VKGSVGSLWLQSKGIDLGRETAVVNGARLADAQLDIALSDTAETDTTPSNLKWKIDADSLTISRTDLTLHLPGDTLDCSIGLGKAVARQVSADLATPTYNIGSIDISDSRLAYEPIGLSDVVVGVDSITYSPAGTSLFIRQAALRDKSGLEVTALTGGIRLDSAFNHIQVPQLVLKTPDSDIEFDGDIDLSAFDKQSPGNIRVRLFAQIGKQDILTAAGQLPQEFIERYPNRPLTIRGSVNGNMEQLDITSIETAMPVGYEPKSCSRRLNSACARDAANWSCPMPSRHRRAQVCSTSVRNFLASPSFAPLSWNTTRGWSSPSTRMAWKSSARPASRTTRLSGASLDPAMASRRTSLASTRSRSADVPTA
jgi:hypothetical protein